MRTVGTLVTIVLLSGCCLFKGTPAEPTASTASLASAQSANAKADSRLGAIIAVASENAENPETVKAELKIASAYLPFPTPGELNYVRQRVARNNPAEYEKAVKDAAKAKADLDALWGQMEIEQKKYEEQIKGLIAQSERQKKEIEQAKKDADRNLYGLAAVALLAIGGIAIAHNVRSDTEVDDIVAAARAAGARVVREPGPTFYGGYAAYFRDPDGHLWEIAHNPGFPLGADGALTIPDFAPPGVED